MKAGVRTRRRSATLGREEGAHNSFQGRVNEDLRFQRILSRGETSYGSSGDRVGSCPGAGRSGSPSGENAVTAVLVGPEEEKVSHDSPSTNRIYLETTGR